MSVSSKVTGPPLGSMPASAALQLLADNGIDITRAKFRNEIRSLCKATTADASSAPLESLSIDAVSALNGHPESAFCKALTGSLAIPHFDEFTSTIQHIYDGIKAEVHDGSPADYIPILADADPNWFSVSICTVDGQQFSYGDVSTAFSIQSCTKPIMYATAVEDRGLAYVHRTVSFEPSGLSFNEVSLNKAGKPHNPYINSGAIATGALIAPGLDNAAKFRHFMNKLQDIAGAEKIGFSHATYLCEHETAWRNNALVAFMTDAGVFPKTCKPSEALDFYLQCCSIEVDITTAATIAATLANGGECPLTGVAALSPITVKSTISLMFSCGMYDYSGTWMSEVGLPAKSGVAGLIYVVVPGVMGIAVFAPPLDSHGNSVRGVEFCRRLLKHYPFGIFDQIVSGKRITSLMPKRGAMKSPVRAKHSGKDRKAKEDVQSETMNAGQITFASTTQTTDEGRGSLFVHSVPFVSPAAGGQAVKAGRTPSRPADATVSAHRMDAWVTTARHIRRAERALQRIRLWCGLPLASSDVTILQSAAIRDPNAPTELLVGTVDVIAVDADEPPLSYLRYKEYRAKLLQHELGDRVDEESELPIAILDDLQRQIRPTASAVPAMALRFFLELQGIQIGKANPFLQGLWKSIAGLSNALDASGGKLLCLADIIQPGHLNNIVLKALTGSLAMPNFQNFAGEIESLYEQIKLTEGTGSVYNAVEIEEIKSADPELFGISIVTVDGQNLHIGDCGVEFPLMGAVRPLLYALSCKDVGIQEVGRWVGVEPTSAESETFNLIPAYASSGHGSAPGGKKDVDRVPRTPDPAERGDSDHTYRTADKDTTAPAHPRPYNAFLDSGALAICSLIGRAHQPADERLFHDNGSRFSHMISHFEKWCGNRRIGFNNSVFLAQKQKRLKTMAISYYAKGMGVYPPLTDPTDAAHYLFQAEAVEVNCENLAVIAATFANIGVCPLTQEKCLEPQVMRSVLSQMYNSGLGPFSGHFMFTAGIPSSAGSSGAHLIVVPGVMGIAIYSPKLNDYGIPHRGVRFCEQLTNKYRVNIFDQLVYSDAAVEIDTTQRKVGPTTQEQTLMQYELCCAAGAGDVSSVKALLSAGADPNVADYDRRTPLHVACSDGHDEVVRWLLDAGAEALVCDRWGNTPYHEAARRGYHRITRLLESAIISQGHRIPKVGPETADHSSKVVSSPYAAASFVDVTATLPTPAR